MATIKDFSQRTNFSSLVFVVDDGGIYNVIPASDFNEKGRYLPNLSYSWDEFEVETTFTNMDAAFRVCERLNEEMEMA